MAAMEALGARSERLPEADIDERVREVVRSARTPEQARLVFDYLTDWGEHLRTLADGNRGVLFARLASFVPGVDSRAAGRAARQAADGLLFVGRHDEAVSLAHEIEKDDRFRPADTKQVRILGALALAATGRFRDARRSLRAIAGEGERSVDAQKLQHEAIILQGEGRLGEALRAFADLANDYRDVETLSLSGRVACAHLLAVGGRWSDAEKTAREVARESGPAGVELRVLLRRSFLAIRCGYERLRAEMEERALGRQVPGRGMIRDELLLNILRELTGDRDRAVRNLEALERSLGESRFWRYVLPASFLLGKAPAEEVRRNTIGLCLFSPDLSSSSLFYMLSRVLLHRGDGAGSKELLEHAIEVDPFNFWPAILARRELGKLTPAMKKFLGKR
jgi:tetratricopeptide (TPR) repeat protein